MYHFVRLVFVEEFPRCFQISKVKKNEKMIRLSRITHLIALKLGLREIGFFRTNENPFFIISLLGSLNNIFDCISN